VVLRAGTSGFAYAAWKGSFYPEGLPAREMLHHYAQRLPAVEINNTFYRMPKVAVLESWASQVPAGFRFAIKASRRITHIKRLSDVAEETGFLLGNLAALGERLGAVLFQLPPSLRADLERLERFLDLLPETLPAAFEFRHASWRDDAVTALLRARGAAWCTADTDDEPAEEPVSTAGFGYLRLRRADYAPADLAHWAHALRGPGWREAYVFFKHESQGPRLAQDLLQLAARPAAAARVPRREREAG
jgi:uncharacterized protein YecE (DUF72 family)